MLILKLLGPIIVFIAAILKDIVSDKKRNKTWKKILLFSMIGALVVSIWLILIDNDNNIKYKIKSDHKIDSLISISDIFSKKQDSNNIIVQYKVDELNKKLDPFVKLAISKYPNDNIQTALEKLTNEISETKEMVKPNRMVYVSHEVWKQNGSYFLNIAFKPEKNVPLGNIEVLSYIRGNPYAKIQKIWSFSSTNSKDTISLSGQKAELLFTPMDAMNIWIGIQFSDICEVRIKGNNDFTPMWINVIPKK